MDLRHPGQKLSLMYFIEERISVLSTNILGHEMRSNCASIKANHQE